MICISKTILNNTSKDNDLNLNSYSLLSQSSEQCKRGRVCIYYKRTLALEMIMIPYLNENLLCDVTIGPKKSIIGIVYRSPNQYSEDNEYLQSKFEFLLQDISSRNTYLTVLLGDHNARNTKWWHHDITTAEGTQLGSTTTIYWVQQLIDETTHTRKNRSSCMT